MIKRFRVFATCAAFLLCLPRAADRSGRTDRHKLQQAKPDAQAK